MLFFDIKRFLVRHFESPANLVSVYSSIGATPPSIAAVEKWFQRGSVPGSHLAILLYIVERNTGFIRVTDFVKGGSIM